MAVIKEKKVKCYQECGEIEILANGSVKWCRWGKGPRESVACYRVSFWGDEKFWK